MYGDEEDKKNHRAGRVWWEMDLGLAHRELLVLPSQAGGALGDSY